MLLKINENVSIPHINNFASVDSLAQLMASVQEKGSILTLNGITEAVGTVDESGRIAHYYGDLLIILGVAEPVYDSYDRKAYALTELGMKFLALTAQERAKIYHESLMSLPLYATTHISNPVKTRDRKVSAVISWHNQLNALDNKIMDINPAEAFSISSIQVDKNYGKYVSHKRSTPGAGQSKTGSVCDSCFMAMPLTNVCDNCD